MTDLLILIRNLVLATILAWLGLEFSPSAPEKDEGPSDKAPVLALLG
ncbi:hypothetical protein [Hyphomonas sp.]|jgi:hypothetical protein|nr:hypothetical protein [Hyphomonas sp.]